MTEVDEPKTRSLVKPRRWNNFILKFQNLKQIFLIRANQNKVNMKNNSKQIKSNFFSRKIWNKNHQNFSTMLLWSWEIWFMTRMLVTLYTFYHIPKMYRQWDSEHFYLPWLCLDMASIMVPRHAYYNLVTVLSTEFLWHG